MAYHPNTMNLHTSNRQLHGQYCEIFGNSYGVLECETFVHRLGRQEAKAGK